MKLTVYGIPIPQGSKTGFVVNGRAVLTDGKKGPALKEWRQAIAGEARKWLETNRQPVPKGPVAMEVSFYLPRPKSTPKRVTRPATKPDLDKLIRAVGDALKGLAYEEDSRIVTIFARKFFTVDVAPHAVIEVVEVQ